MRGPKRFKTSATRPHARPAVCACVSVDGKKVGDALIRVNHEQLTLLNHDKVVSVLRGLLNTSGSQVLLLRFELGEDSRRQQQQPTTPTPSYTPTGTRIPAPLGPSPSSETRSLVGARGLRG